MRPKILDMLFKDDRMFILEVSPVRTSTMTSSEQPKNEWAVITRRNVPGYPHHRIDTFPTKTDAVEFYKQVVVTTPRVSLGNKTPIPPPTIEEYTNWLIDEGLYDPLLNPGVTGKKDA